MVDVPLPHALQRVYTCKPAAPRACKTILEWHCRGYLVLSLSCQAPCVVDTYGRGMCFIKAIWHLYKLDEKRGQISAKADTCQPARLLCAARQAGNAHAVPCLMHPLAKFPAGAPMS